jgi:hypothetical protein
METKCRVENHNPVPLVRLEELTGLLLELGEKQAMIYLDAKFKDGTNFTHSWVIYSGFFNTDPLFINPFTGEWFCRSELKEAWGRLIQPGEVLNIEYHGVK